MDTLVIITGHSSGLGEALAAEYLQKDFSVLGISRRSNKALADKFSNLKEAILDLSDVNSLNKYLLSNQFTELLRAYKTIWLFNNAGTVGDCQVLGKQDNEQLIAGVQLNITAAMLMSNAVMQSDRAQVNIIHISSGAGRKSYTGWSFYGASKAALDQHARVVSSENHPNLKIVSFAPGIIDSGMQEKIRNNEDFPLQARFQALKKDRALQSPQETASGIIAYCNSSHFAEKAVDDIRNYA